MPMLHTLNLSGFNHISTICGLDMFIELKLHIDLYEIFPVLLLMFFHGPKLKHYLKSVLEVVTYMLSNEIPCGGAQLISK